MSVGRVLAWREGKSVSWSFLQLLHGRQRSAWRGLHARVLLRCRRWWVEADSAGSGGPHLHMAAGGWYMAHWGVLGVT
jgi:hypothetical protein